MLSLSIPKTYIGAIIFISHCSCGVFRCSQSELEGERGERERVQTELTQSKAKLLETQEIVATLEERVAQSDQLNSDLQTQLT